MKHITIGILAHVDAGKTTLSEGLLYTAGSIRQLGRVDDQNAFLDNNHMDKKEKSLKFWPEILNQYLLLNVG